MCNFFLFSPLRSIHRLTQLERLDLGSNEFTELVRLNYCNTFLCHISLNKKQEELYKCLNCCMCI